MAFKKHPKINKHKAGIYDSVSKVLGLSPEIETEANLPLKHRELYGCKDFGIRPVDYAQHNPQRLEACPLWFEQVNDYVLEMI